MEQDKPQQTERHGVAAELWQIVSDYRWRILASLLFLITAKIATVGVPLVLKRIIDAFAAPGRLALLPIYLLAGYAILRFLSTLFNELRDLLFARVTLRTVSAYAQKIFSGKWQEAGMGNQKALFTLHVGKAR